MRFANVRNRLCLIRSDGAVDIAHASGGRFPADPGQVLEQWDEFVAWAAVNATVFETYAATPVAAGDLGAPVPAPPQIFAIGLNYRDHAAEANLDLPEGNPVVFAKFPSSVVGPDAEVTLPRTRWTSRPSSSSSSAGAAMASDARTPGATWQG